MKKNIITFLAGVVFGAAATTIAGLLVCEYVEALPEVQEAQSDAESDDYDD